MSTCDVPQNIRHFLLCFHSVPRPKSIRDGGDPKFKAKGLAMPTLSTQVKSEHMPLHLTSRLK
jgi:hypothetical protein